MCKVVSWAPDLIGKHASIPRPRVFSRSALLMFWGQIILTAGNCPARHWMSGGHPWPLLTTSKLYPCPQLWKTKECLQTLQNTPWGTESPWLKTTAQASHWSRKYPIEEKDVFLLLSHKLDSHWFPNILVETSSLCGIRSAGYRIFTREMKSWNEKLVQTEDCEKRSMSQHCKRGYQQAMNLETFPLEQH